MWSQFLQQELKLAHQHSEIRMKVAVITAPTYPQVTGTTRVLTNKLQLEHPKNSKFLMLWNSTTAFNSLKAKSYTRKQYPEEKLVQFLSFMFSVTSVKWTNALHTSSCPALFSITTLTCISLFPYEMGWTYASLVTDIFTDFKKSRLSVLRYRRECLMRLFV